MSLWHLPYPTGLGGPGTEAKLQAGRNAPQILHFSLQWVGSHPCFPHPPLPVGIRDNAFSARTAHPALPLPSPETRALGHRDVSLLFLVAITIFSLSPKSAEVNMSPDHSFAKVTEADLCCKDDRERHRLRLDTSHCSPPLLRPPPSPNTGNTSTGMPGTDTARCRLAPTVDKLPGQVARF